MLHYLEFVENYTIVIKIFILQMAAIVMVLPFIWLVSTALKNPAEVFTENLSLIPETFRWSNFAEIMDQAPLWLYMGNTIIVCPMAYYLAAMWSIGVLRYMTIWLFLAP